MTAHSSGQALESRKSEVLRGIVGIPGDKSISHRALMLASQFLGKTEIFGLLEGEDVLNTAAALGQLGVRLGKEGTRWWVEGVGIGGLSESSGVLDMGNSGTSTRLLMGLVTPYPFTTFFTGDDSLRSRPMKRVTMPLEQIGAQITAREGGRLPLALTGTASPLPITYRLPVASAQVKSAVLLAGLNTAGITTVIEPVPTRDHTERMLSHFSLTLEQKALEDGAISTSLRGHQETKPQDRSITVPGDPSSAAFPIVAALLREGSELTMPNICINPLRIGLFTTLKEMGAQIEYRNERIVAGEQVADLYVRASKLKGVTVPASRAPSMIDEYPILAIAAACADGETVMEGLAELRVKESDRLAAIAEGLASCGVAVKVEGDTLRVTGNGTAPKGGALIATRLDHRIAMAFLVLGLVSQEPVTVDDGSAINTSFPDFVPLMNRIGARITVAAALRQTPLIPRVVAIDGPAASGKGTLARRLAEHFGYSYLDTGSLYRAVGLKLTYSDQDANDVEAAVEAARTIDTEDLANPRLRQERIGQAASIVAAMPEVRKELLAFQRRFAAKPEGTILDGRDIGTVVCPEADLKIFITADLEARAKRRWRELQGEGIEVVYQSVLDDLIERDQRDAQRHTAPLTPAPDAILLDTSELDANSVFQKVLGIIEGRE